MKLEGRQQRLTIYLGESDRHGHTPLATEIVQRAHAAGLAGASVFRGVEGFGASNHEGLVTLEEVEVVTYVGRPGAPR
jgi:PII-like signaling protein